MSWIAAALLAALCAGITSILAKCGMRDTDSDIATGIRTAVVLVFAWLVVFVTDAQAGIGNIAPLSWAFLITSGVATGASWLCYFKALSLGDVNKVVPVDKSSAAIAALLAIVLFGETSSLAVKLISIVLITVGTYLMIEKKPKGNDTSVMQDTNAHGHGWLLCYRGCSVCSTHVDTREGRNRGSRLKPSYRDSHVCRAGNGLGNSHRAGEAEARLRCETWRVAFSCGIWSRNRSILVVLLLRHTGRSSERSGAN